MRIGGISTLACMLAACGAFDSADAPADSGAPDGGSAIDAGSDGADPRPFCDRQDTRLFLCDDFQGEPPWFKWTEKAAHGGGLIENPGGSFVARAGPTVAGQAWAYLRKDLGDTTNEIVVSFSMRHLKIGIEGTEAGGLQIAEGSFVRYATMLRVTADGALGISESVTGDGGDAGPSVTSRAVAFSKSPNPLQWARFTFHWKLNGDPSLKVVLDGDPTPVVDMKLMLPTSIGTRQFLLGLDYFTLPGTAVELDDVTIDRE